MNIEAGRLRHLVRIDRLVNQLDTDGDVIQDPNTGEVLREWEAFAQVRAAIEPLSTREFIQSQAVQSEIVARIVIRYRTGLDASMRLVHIRNGADFAIYNPAGFLADKETGLEYLTIPCSAGLIVEEDADGDGDASLDFSIPTNSQYLALVSVGGM